MDKLPESVEKALSIYTYALMDACSEMTSLDNADSEEAELRAAILAALASERERTIEEAANVISQTLVAQDWDLEDMRDLELSVRALKSARRADGD